MESKELRVGNVYKWYADGTYYYYKVEEKDFMSDNLKNFEPVELTDEVLLKCGFKKVDDYEFYFPTDTISFTYNIANKYISINDYNIQDFELKVKYLHQLQNLYWCLTGKELEINVL